MDEPLPSPRTLLTSLLNALSSIPPPESQPSTSTSHEQHPTSNALKHLPPSSRPLLTTLHVLYPTILLPALDLLGRRLLTRVLVLGSPSSSDEITQARLDAQASVFYLVRSAQQQRSGRGRGGGGSTETEPVYVVRTHAWNCSCAAFAFSAFPPTSRGAEVGYDIAPVGAGLQKPDEMRWAADAERWDFGGLSLDGVGGEGASAGVPCCKHLLACVLAERWTALNSYVEERKVGREEAAGLIGNL